MSCLIHHFSHSVRSTYLTYSHFYYLHLSIPNILYHLYFIFHFSFKSFISNLSYVYFFNISIPYIYIHMRCWTKLFCQGKNNIYDFSKPLLDSFSCWLSIVPAKYFGDLLSRYFPPYKIWPFAQTKYMQIFVHKKWTSFLL